MDAKLPDILEVDISTFEKLISAYVGKMGFTVESTKETSDGDIHYIAKTTNPMGGEITSLIRAGPYEKEIDRPLIEDLYADMQEKGAVRAAFITTSDFTRSAVEYASDKPISLINKYELMESLRRSGVELDESLLKLLESHGLSEERYRGEKHAFEIGMTEDAALAYFKGRARRKKLGLFGVSEELTKLEKRYAPVGVFKVTLEENVESKGGSYTKLEKEDYVFINLNNLDWYYLCRKRSGSASKHSLEHSGVIAEINSLPDGAKSHLLDLLDHGDLPHDNLDGKDLAILKSKGIVSVYESKSKGSGTLNDTAHLLIYITQELMDFITIMIQDVLGESTADINRELGGDVSGGDGKKHVTTDINLPHSGGGVYNLRRFLSVERGMPFARNEDKVRHSSRVVGKVLASLFQAEVEPQGVLFMPYYDAAFSAKGSGDVRREILISPLFVTEDKPKKLKKVKPEPSSTMFKGVPYKTIK